MSWWKKKPSVRELLQEIQQSLVTLIGEQRKMSQATTNLQSAVGALQTTASAILDRLKQPPVGEDPVAVQAEADKVAAVTADFQAALNPPAA